MGSRVVTPIMEMLIRDGFYRNILEVIVDHLNRAKECALQLNFQFFLRHIERARKAVASSKRLLAHGVPNA